MGFIAIEIKNKPKPIVNSKTKRSIKEEGKKTGWAQEALQPNINYTKKPNPSKEGSASLPCITTSVPPVSLLSLSMILENKTPSLLPQFIHSPGSHSHVLSTHSVSMAFSNLTKEIPPPLSLLKLISDFYKVSISILHLNTSRFPSSFSPSDFPTSQLRTPKLPIQNVIQYTNLISNPNHHSYKKHKSVSQA